MEDGWSLYIRRRTEIEKNEGMILAENGGLDVELEPEGVLGNWWKAGACKLNREEPLLETP